jgi:hypothetical protein
MGMYLRATAELPLYLLPHVEWILHFQKDRVRYLDWETSGSLSLLSRPITLCDCSYLEWRIYFRWEID